MENKFLAKLDGSLQYTKLQNFEGFSKWFECKLPYVATNLLQWFYPQEDKVHWTMEVASLWEKISWWAKFSKNFSKKKARLAPWMEEGAWNLLAQIGSNVVLWIPIIENVLPLSSGDNQGGYGVVHKVRFERFNHIPSMIKLARKTSKLDDKQEAHKQWLVEVLACLCKHPCVIEFFAIHT